MSWIKEDVIKTLINSEGYQKFLNESAVLPVRVSGVDLLFYYVYDDVEIYYKKYLNREEVDLTPIEDFCKYAQPYLKTEVSRCRYERLINL